MKELYVFQRTPSTIDVRDQRVTKPEEIEAWSREPGWAKARRERLAKISSGRTALKANDDYMSGKVEAVRPPRQYEREISPEELIQKQLNSNFRIMEQIRGRIDAIVRDPKTAEALKPYYPYGCKRPTFHDEFLPSFNLPHVHLVDTAPLGVQRINERGVVHGDVEYPLDVLIYATGFQWMATSTFNMITGRGGRTLREKWQAEGVRTFLGLHTQGFRTCSSCQARRAAAGSSTSPGVSRATPTTWCGCCRRCGNAVPQSSRSARSRRRATPNTAARPTSGRARCVIACPITTVTATPNRGSLAYYGGPETWHKLRRAAQETLEPYVFEARG